jgi:hypothetical protein
METLFGPLNDQLRLIKCDHCGILTRETNSKVGVTHKRSHFPQALCSFLLYLSLSSPFPPFFDVQLFSRKKINKIMLAGYSELRDAQKIRLEWRRWHLEQKVRAR